MLENANALLLINISAMLHVQHPIVIDHAMHLMEFLTHGMIAVMTKGVLVSVHFVQLDVVIRIISMLWMSSTQNLTFVISRIRSVTVFLFSYPPSAPPTALILYPLISSIRTVSFAMSK